jgi:hypothetical protein
VRVRRTQFVPLRYSSSPLSRSCPLASSSLLNPLTAIVCNVSPRSIANCLSLIQSVLGRRTVRATVSPFPRLTRLSFGAISALTFFFFIAFQSLRSGVMHSVPHSASVPLATVGSPQTQSVELIRYRSEGEPFVSVLLHHLNDRWSWLRWILHLPRLSLDQLASADCLIPCLAPSLPVTLPSSWQRS